MGLLSGHPEHHAVGANYQIAQYCPTCGTPVGENTARLVVIVQATDCEPFTYELAKDDVTIGTDPECDVVIDGDTYVSRQHARLVRSDGLLYLEDLKSSNGTLLRVHHPLVLEDGDEIFLGTTTIRIRQA